jgi:exoribonuclease-2
MNNVFYEEEGVFKTGHILSEADSSLLIEDTRGKRSKLKTQQVWLRFDKIALDAFLVQAQALAQDIDLDFLWSCCDQEEFFFEALAQEYFGNNACGQEKAAIAISLFSAPMYFYRKGKGHFKAAPEASLQAAIAGQAKRQRELEQIQAWKAILQQGTLPDTFMPLLSKLLHRPDKNSPEYKALAQAASELQLTPLRLLQKNGAIPDIEAYFLQGFLLEAFPKGTDFPLYQPINLPMDLPQASVQAFSIDDSSTTEIDDAFSLVSMGSGHYQVGIHIAVPALGILPGSVLDQKILERLSTVYIPGKKITMLPEKVIEDFTLQRGKKVPALSLYIDINPSFEPLSFRTQLEYITVADNLRIEELSTVFNEYSVLQDSGVDYPYKAELIWLWHCANQLEIRRNKVPTPTQARVDYNFYIDQIETGEKHVRIEPRKRGSPIDKVVSELMILANSQWGRILAEANIAAIYRAQTNGKVRMTVIPSPHVGLGVAQYAWLTSPLRRAVDFINQQQLLAHTLGLKPRFTANDTNLFSIMASFDSAYSLYGEFQDKMEKYWCLRYLEQEHITELTATVVKENLVRFEGLPLYQRIAGLPALAPGAAVSLQRIAINYLDLTLECRVTSHV